MRSLRGVRLLNQLTLNSKIIAGRINDLAWDGESKRIIAVGDGKERYAARLKNIERRLKWPFVNPDLVMPLHLTLGVRWVKSVDITRWSTPSRFDTSAHFGLCTLLFSILTKSNYTYHYVFRTGGDDNSLVFLHGGQAVLSL